MNDMNTNADVAIMDAADMTEAVRSTAMLADISISQWSGSKSDPSMIEDAKKRAGATGDIGRAVKNLLAGADGDLKECKSAFNAVRTEHYALTLPWVTDPHATKHGGPRLLTTVLFDEYMTRMSMARREALAQLDKFVATYPDKVVIAKGNLGDLASDADYPSQDEVRKAFKVSFDFQPIPAGTQFKGLPAETMGKLAKQLARRQERMISTAQASMWEQARERVAYAVERLADPEAKFKSSTIEAVQELLVLMPGWNIASDPRVAEIVEDINRMISGVNAKSLRTDATARMEATQKGRAVVEKLRSWGL